MQGKTSIQQKRRMGIVHFSFHIVLLSWWSINALAKGPPAIAQRGCKSKCGDVEIPFPFGMEQPDCYLDVWFEVVCDETSSLPRPILKRIDLQILEISASGGNLKVLGPILPMGSCENTFRRSSTFEALAGGPFVFSKSMNNFAAVSCGNIALMYQDDHAVGGCMSVCNETTDQLFGRCNGINCCQAALPDNLVTLNVTSQEFSASGGEQVQDGCKYAFIAAEESFNSYEDTVPFEDMPKLVGVPVVLEWWFPNMTFPGITGINCLKNSTGTPSPGATMKFRCSCKWPPQGNPYIAQGCQDIECVDVIEGYVCRSIQPEEESKTRRMIMIGVFTGVLGLLSLLIGGWWLNKVLKRRREIALKKKFFKRNGGLLLQQQLASGEVNVDKIKMFNSDELEKATDHFNVNRMLGQGGQGTVYKGMLADGRIVAVKKSKVVDEGKLDQFINEVVILSQINQRNVVNLLGCCLETEVPLLVYEFIPNGTLFEYLHGQNEEFPLTWDRRLRIAAEIAGALFYLHSQAALPIYHRDIKSTNILLDDKYRAKVADFGTSKTVSIDQTHVTTMVQGTFGYLDPEYFQSSQFTEKSDVYSFGVVLVELLTGQKPISSTRTEEGRSLAAYFILTMEGNRLLDIIDPQVIKEDRKEEVMAVAVLARRCLNLNGRNRPTMKEVTMELERIQKSQNANDSQNCKEMEYAEADMIGYWDTETSSTGSYLDGGIVSSSDTKPFLSITHE